MPVKNHQCRYGYELCHETYLGLNHDHNVVSCTCLEYFSNYYKINWIKYIDEYYDAFKETLEIYFCNYFSCGKIFMDLLCDQQRTFLYGSFRNTENIIYDCDLDICIPITFFKFQHGILTIFKLIR